VSTYHVPVRKWHGLPLKPTTHLGWWAAVLAVGSGVGWLMALPALLFAPSNGVCLPWGLLLLVASSPGLGAQSQRRSLRFSQWSGAVSERRASISATCPWRASSLPQCCSHFSQATER